MATLPLADLEFHYDPYHRLAVATDASGQSLEGYAYDAFGRLAQVYDFGTRTHTVHVADGDQTIAAYDDSGALAWRAIWGAHTDQLLEWEGQNGVMVPLVDHRNSSAALWSGSAEAVVETFDYDPHGLMTVRGPDETQEADCSDLAAPFGNCQPTSAIPFQFVSAWRSRQTGMTLMRNRWYSPELRQFLSQDPMGYADAYNPYAYVGYDPINAFDPYGLAAQSFTPEDYDRWYDPAGRFATRAWLLGEATPEVRNQWWTRRQKKKFGDEYLREDAGDFYCGWVCQLTILLEGGEGAADLIGFTAAGKAGVKAGIKKAASKNKKTADDVAEQGKKALDDGNPGGRGDGRGGRGNGGSGDKPLYRAVKNNELNDIKSTGEFRNPPGNERKYFAETAEGAASYAKQAYGLFGDMSPYTMVRTWIDPGLIEPMMRSNVDRGIRTVVVPTEKLPALRKPDVLESMPVPKD